MHPVRSAEALSPALSPAAVQVFDGHSGAGAAASAADHLLDFVVKQQDLIDSPEQALVGQQTACGGTWTLQCNEHDRTMPAEAGICSI